jgi:2-methylcitrate dehydratase PrpD
MRSAVEHIAAFAATARPEHLISDIRQLFKRNILDSLGCARLGSKVRQIQPNLAASSVPRQVRSFMEIC